jgi:ArsR family transcriptional regulator
MKIADEELKNKAEVLKVMGHPERLRILKLLLVNKEMCIKEICEALGFTQQKVSQHIGVMKEVEIVKSRKRGTRSIYYIDNTFAKKVVGVVFWGRH